MSVFSRGSHFFHDRNLCPLFCGSHHRNTLSFGCLFLRRKRHSLFLRRLFEFGGHLIRSTEKNQHKHINLKENETRFSYLPTNYHDSHSLVEASVYRHERCIFDIDGSSIPFQNMLEFQHQSIRQFRRRKRRHRQHQYSRIWCTYRGHGCFHTDSHGYRENSRTSRKSDQSVQWD